MELNAASSLFRAVADPLRLRVLQLLHAEELSVGELVRIVDLPQSSVSRHLKVLRDEGLVTDRAQGPATYYRAALDTHLANGQHAIRQALAALLPAEGLLPGDLDRLERVRALRTGDQARFFDQIGLQWDVLREQCFGPAFHLEAFLSLLPPWWTVADLGTGTGYLLPSLARHFARVVAVDSSAPMLELARRRAEDAGVLPRVELVEGRLEHLPMADGSADLALAILMLHHLEDIPAALAEIARVLKPGGQLLVVDLEPHDNANFQVRMADRLPGIAPQELARLLAAAGLSAGEPRRLAPSAESPAELGQVPGIYVLTAQCAASRTRGLHVSAGITADDSPTKGTAK